MIKLIPDNLLIEDDSGELSSFNLDAMNDQLEKAFASVGIKDAWIASHLSMLIEEKIRERNSRGIRLDEAGVVQMLENILCVAGYDDVAQKFRALRNHELVQEENQNKTLPQSMESVTKDGFGPLVSWKEDVVTEILVETLPISQEQAACLGRDCMGVLTQLGFHQATRVFICELAFHLLHYRRKDNSELEPDLCGRERTRYIPAEVWRRQALQAEAELMASGILVPLPVSDIFPTARVKVYLDKAGDLMENWENEMEQLTENLRMGEVFGGAVHVLLAMRTHISRIWPNFEHPSMQLVLPGIKLVLRKYPVRRRRFVAEKIVHSVNQLLGDEQLQVSVVLA